MTKITRRELARGLAAGVAANLLPRADALAAAVSPEPTSAARAGSVVAGWTQLFPGVWRAEVGEPQAITPVRLRSVPPATAALGAMSHVATPPIAAPVMSVGRRGTTVHLPLAPGEQVYGFGLQFFAVQHRGRKRVTRVNADPRGDTGDSHAPVPFYVTDRGYGVLVDAARYVTFYCGEARPKPTRARSGTVADPEAFESRSLEPGQASEVIAEVPNSSGVSVYLFAGPTMLEAVRRYNLFSGGGVLPPEWGLGFWYRAHGEANAQQVVQLAREFRERNIPCDVIGLEPGWQTHAYSCTFEWNPQRFPEPGQFVQAMTSRGYHVNLWEHAFTHPTSPLFAPLRELSGDKGVWGGLVPDFIDARARRVFGAYHGEKLIDLGIDGFKLDECDNSDYTGGWSFAELSRFPSGADGEQMHCLFGQRYQQAIWEQYRQRSRETYGLVRSSGALAAPFPFVLYSDLYDHRQFVRALVNSGFSGLLWCPEVRDAASEEDLIRRLQAVVFSPLAMVNGWYIRNPPWKQLEQQKNNANELLPDWERLEARCREIIGWRMQLVPYLRAAFARYAQDGTPPFRALALDWPHEPDVARVDDAWLVGDRMLVAPLFAGEPGRTVLLPPGDWHDFWTGQHTAGGTRLQVDAGQANIPVFVKSGSILPLAEITNSTADPASRALHVQVFGTGDLFFVLPTGATSARFTWDASRKQGRVEGELGAYRVAGWDVRG